MKRIFPFLIILFAFCISTYPQNPIVPYEFKAQYHMIDSSELFAPKLPGKSFTQTNPPTGTVRAIAEWEPAQAVLISYPSEFGIPYSLIAEMSQDCKVITMVTSSSEQTTATNNYNSNGVNTANCLFKVAPLDSYWARDYGPWFIMTNNNTIGIVDFPYNRPSRPNDDNVPVVMSTYLSEPLYGMNVMTTGGNYMCDGMGAAAMTDLIEDDNTSLTVAQIDTAFKQYLGITHNYITTDPLGQYIKHIDCWGKFLDVDKILIASVPTSNSHYTAYEAMATYWANQVSSYGDNYQVYRVYEPNGQPYTNSVILNKKVLIPFASGTSNTTNNNNALAVYQQAMPGYEVIGFSQLSSAPWESTDALHCRAHEIADKGMLYIMHYPLLGQKPIQSQYPINAEIYALSGSAILADSVYVKYRVYHSSWGAWTKILMTNTTGNTWTAEIPQQQNGDTIAYYIHASDQSPRSETHPLIGQPDPHKFYLYGSTTAVAENESLKALVFPNPAVDYLFIQMKNTGNAAMSVRIYDMVGKEILSINENNLDDHMVRVDVNKFTAGTYFVNITCGNFSETRKIIVMH